MTDQTLNVVGQSIPRRDGLGHVTGKTAEEAADQAVAADGDNFTDIGSGYRKQFKRGYAKLLCNGPVECLQPEHGFIIQLLCLLQLLTD